jgi:hypothetical protein
MHTLRLVPVLMLFTLLTGQSLLLPGQSNALTCCPCYNPCKIGCVCRGTQAHCPVCRAGSPDLFQVHAAPIIPASDFTSNSESLAITLPTTDLPNGIVALERERNRRIDNLTSRLLPSAEFRIKAWCPGPLDKSI